MARKKPPEEHENAERWLVSYADFITLLFAFFVILYAISSVNEGKYRVLSDSLISAFHAPPRSLEPIQIGQQAKSPVLTNMNIRSTPSVMKAPSLTIKDKHIVDGAKVMSKREEVYDRASSRATQQELKEMADELEKALKNLIEQKLVSIKRNDFWIEVELRSSILFYSGSSELQNSIKPILASVAGIINKFDNPVRVEGFTDDLPIDNIIYPSNWELSVSRASSVVRVLQTGGVNPERLSATGYGQYRPVSESYTEIGRIMNRRVVIVILANHDLEMLYTR